MRLKTVEVEGKQYAEIDDEGRVLYDNDGKEFAFDAAQAYGKIQELQNEAKTNREAKQQMADKLKALDGVDPDKYQEAISALEKIDQKKLMDSGEVDKLRKEIEDSWREKYDTDVGEAQKKLQEMQSQYNGEKLASAFSGSKFIKDLPCLPIWLRPPLATASRSKTARWLPMTRAATPFTAARILANRQILTRP